MTFLRLGWATQKETISLPCCGLRYYCPRSKFVPIPRGRLGGKRFGSVIRRRGQLSSHADGFRLRRRLTWVILAASLLKLLKHPFRFRQQPVLTPEDWDCCE